MTKSWLPLEANPEILTTYCRGLGLPENLAFHDVLGVEEWAIEMLPQPLCAILLLFPISAASERERTSTKCSGENNGVYFMKQMVGNACGTIAVLHAMLNLQETGDLVLQESSYVSRMREATRTLSADARGAWLEKDSEIETAHIATEQLGQSAAPTDSQVDVDTHFIAFLRIGRTVYELDGRRDGPVVRASLDDPGEFGPRTLEVIKREFMDRNPEDIRFNILALAPSESD